MTGKNKKSAYHDYSVWDKMISGQMNNDLLILGSSRAWEHYSPSILDSTLKCNSYYLGRDGKKQDVSILCYKIYSRYNPKPKVVLCDIYFMSMCKSDPYDMEQFYPYLIYDDFWYNIYKTHQFR